ncbi:MAG: DUF364 domain-containing protein [Thiothrix sp.]
MTLATDLLAQVDHIRQVLPLPAIARLYFPTLQTDGEYRDEFGFVFLESGDIGAFYVSLEDTLPELWRQFPNPEQASLPLDVLLGKLQAPDLASRALGLGAFNALSQHVLRLGGCKLSQHRNHDRDNLPVPVGKVGMVGYFCPVIDRLTEQGIAVLVLEKVPQRVPTRPLVSVTTNPLDLASCDEVMCTASTLINDTLDGILEACGHVPDFSLIGPSAGGLPDVVFARGVEEVGATVYPDREKLLYLLANQDSWGKAGQKYRIRRADYPGLETLLQRAATVRS